MADLYLGRDNRFYVGDDDDLDDVFSGEDDEDDDELGLEQIIGLDQIIGALKAKAKPKKKVKGNEQLLALLALAKQAGGAATRQRPMTGSFSQPLPIPPTSFTTGQALDIELRPQRLFRVERLVVDSVIAPFFRILDLKVGQNTQFVASGALPSTIFSEVAVGMRLKGDTANLGNTIVISLQNIDANTRVFGGAILGTVIN